MVLVAVDVRSGDTFRTGERRTLFRLEGRFESRYDVSVDGRHFLMIRRLGGHEVRTERVLVVDNVIDELRRVAGN